MWHMLLGNALIGVLEGLLIARFWKLAWSKPVGVMIAANYFSAWSAMLLHAMLLYRYVHRIPLQRLELAHTGLLVGAFVLTLVLEWPFVLAILRKQERCVVQSIKACIGVNVVSYGLIVGLFSLFSTTSFLTATQLVDAKVFPWKSSFEVYFLDEGDAPTALSLPGSARHPVTALQWETVKARAAEYPDRPSRRVRDLRPSGEQDWKFRDAIMWPEEGLSGRRRSTGEVRRLAIATPLVQRFPGRVTILPGDQIVLQLGYEICALDWSTAKIAVLVEGREPIVMLDESKPGHGE
jgi:hypothetical protein